MTAKVDIDLRHLALRAGRDADGQAAGRVRTQFDCRGEIALCRQKIGNFLTGAADQHGTRHIVCQRCGQIEMLA